MPRIAGGPTSSQHMEGVGEEAVPSVLGKVSKNQVVRDLEAW